MPQTAPVQTVPVQTVPVSPEYLSKVVKFTNSATDQLEKLASHEAGLEAFAKKAAEQLADAGLIKPTARKTVEGDILSGGMDKVSEAFSYVIEKLGVETESFGKNANEINSDAELTADQKWDLRFGLTANPS